MTPTAIPKHPRSCAFTFCMRRINKPTDTWHNLLTAFCNYCEYCTLGKGLFEDTACEINHTDIFNAKRSQSTHISYTIPFIPVVPDQHPTHDRSITSAHTSCASIALQTPIRSPDRMLISLPNKSHINCHHQSMDASWASCIDCVGFIQQSWSSAMPRRQRLPIG